MVKGTKLWGIIFDPGAAASLIGTQTLSDFATYVLEPHGRQLVVDEDAPTMTFCGIEGRSQKSPGRVIVPIHLGPLDIDWAAQT